MRNLPNTFCHPVKDKQTREFICPDCGYGKGLGHLHGFTKVCPSQRKPLPPSLKEARKAACKGCEWLSAGRCLAQIKSKCPNQTAPRVDEIAGHLGAKCPDGRWEALVLPSTPSLAGNSVMRWTYGVTTVPSRRQDLLPKTLASLKLAGFDKPRLFVDGADKLDQWNSFGLEVTTRNPTIGTVGNWILALWELYIRHPVADRYVVFQDDLTTYLNLRKYLERIPYPAKGYLNLYTMPHNLKRCNGKGWHLSDQKGKGGLALMFDRNAVHALLKSQHVVYKPSSHRSKRSIDGTVVTGMNQEGFKEYIHSPTLVYHTGAGQSTMGHSAQVPADSFRGEDFDALRLLQ